MSNNSEKLVKDVRRRTRKKYSSEEKIRIVLEGMRGEESIAELCRREGLNQNVYYRWSKEFLEAGKQRLAGDIKREATRDPRPLSGDLCVFASDDPSVLLFHLSRCDDLNEH